MNSLRTAPNRPEPAVRLTTLSSRAKSRDFFGASSRELIRKRRRPDILWRGPRPGVVHTRRRRHRSRRQLRRQHSIHNRSLRRTAQTLSKEIRIQTVGTKHYRFGWSGKRERHAGAGREVAGRRSESSTALQCRIKADGGPFKPAFGLSGAVLLLHKDRPPPARVFAPSIPTRSPPVP